MGGQQEVFTDESQHGRDQGRNAGPGRHTGPAGFVIPAQNAVDELRAVAESETWAWGVGIRYGGVRQTLLHYMLRPIVERATKCIGKAGF